MAVSPHEYTRGCLAARPPARGHVLSSPWLASWSPLTQGRVTGAYAPLEAGAPSPSAVT